MASLRYRNGKWQARITRKGFADESQTFLTKQDAERWARAIEADIDRGTYISQSEAQRTTLAEVIQRYRHPRPAAAPRRDAEHPRQLVPTEGEAQGGPGQDTGRQRFPTGWGNLRCRPVGKIEMPLTVPSDRSMVLGAGNWSCPKDAPAERSVSTTHLRNMSVLSPLASATSAIDTPGCRHARMTEALNSALCLRRRRRPGAAMGDVSMRPRRRYTDTRLL